MAARERERERGETLWIERDHMLSSSARRESILSGGPTKPTVAVKLPVRQQQNGPVVVRVS